jgi:hypothetical protein
MGLNLSTDYKVFNEGDTSVQLMSGTYYSRTNTLTPTYSSFSISNGIKLDTKTVEATGSWGVYCKTFVDFDLAIHDFFTVNDPKVGDYIIDSSLLAYIVVAVRNPVFSDYWGLTTVAPQIIGGEMLIPRTAIETTDAYGGRTITHTSQTAILGWVQPTTQRVADMFGKRGYVDDHNIYLLTNACIKYGDLIQKPNGIEYEIYEVNNSKKIDELQQLKGVIKP